MYVILRIQRLGMKNEWMILTLHPKETIRDQHSRVAPVHCARYPCCPAQRVLAAMARSTISRLPQLEWHEKKDEHDFFDGIMVNARQTGL